MYKEVQHHVVRYQVSVVSNITYHYEASYSTNYIIPILYSCRLNSQHLASESAELSTDNCSHFNCHDKLLLPEAPFYLKSIYLE